MTGGGTDGRPDQSPGYDVIGDVHGHADKLVALLARLGYDERDGVWRHHTRQAVFVGDLIDRGPDQSACVRIARSMVDDGAARVVMGNHEFNAIAFHTPAGEGGYLRPHTKKNRAQHAAFLDQVGFDTAESRDIVGWFETLPLWLTLSLPSATGDGTGTGTEGRHRRRPRGTPGGHRRAHDGDRDTDVAGGDGPGSGAGAGAGSSPTATLRVVHACWSQSAIDVLSGPLAACAGMRGDVLRSAATKGSAEWHAVEHLLKGPEVAVPEPYRDKGGHVRHHARFRWWDPDALTLRSATLIPGGTTDLDGNPYPGLPDTPIGPPVAPYDDPIPVLYGHYWETGECAVSGSRTACVDYSAGKDGPLVAYRWTGEADLTAANYVRSDDPQP